eukprot:11351554-Ditylum_brightwellii.AAC.1
MMLLSAMCSDTHDRSECVEKVTPARDVHSELSSCHNGRNILGEDSSTFLWMKQQEVMGVIMTLIRKMT